MRISSDVYGDAGATIPATPPNNLGQADFLRLMTEQLKHQDPLKPLENNEFLGQLEQFSTVQGINDLKTSFAGLSTAMAGDQVLRGAALVGRTVLVPADKLALEDAGNSIHGVVAASAPGTVEFTITDANGTLVKTITVDAETAGEVAFSWDGTDANGKHLPAGEYSISAAQHAAASGETSTLSTYIEARVESVSIGSDGLYLNLNGLGTAPLAWVLRVS